MESHLQFILTRPRLCMLVGLLPCRSTSRTIPIRLESLGNILLLRREAGTTRIPPLALATPLIPPAIPLITSATLLLAWVTLLLALAIPLLGHRIRHQCRPRTSTTLTCLAPRPRVTRHLGISHPPRSWSILHHPDQPHRPTIHSRARLVTVHLNRPRKRPHRFRSTLVDRASQHHHLLRISTRRSRLPRRIRRTSPLILHLSRDTHPRNLLSIHRHNRGILLKRRPPSHRISRRTILNIKVLTRRTGIFLPLRGQDNVRSLGGKVRSGN